MDRDAEIIRQVEDKIDGKSSSTAFVMDCTWINNETGEYVSISSKRVGGPNPSLPLEELERNADIARARYLYASEQRDEWSAKTQNCYRDMNDALIALYKKKYKLSDKDLREELNQDVNGVFERKDETKGT